MLKLCPLGSGSKGNCIYLESGESRLLIDAGLPFLEIKKRLREIDVRLCDLTGVVITHEHTDHINGLSGFCGSGVPVFVHDYVVRIIESKFPKLDIRGIREEAFDLSGLRVKPFKIPHDAVYPLGYRFTDGKLSASVATDIGRVTESIIDNMKDSDLIVAEANHDEDMLMKGAYPYQLKQRIIGGKGHINNALSAELLAKIVTGRTKNIFLAHLSEENNLPELAFDIVAKYLSAHNIHEGSDVKIEVLKQRERGSLTVVY